MSNEPEPLFRSLDFVDRRVALCGVPMKRKKPEMLGDAPIEEAYRGKMQFLAKQLDHLFNGDLRGQDRSTGFVLMVFPLNEASDADTGRCNYISNGADRKDVVALMKEMIARFEGQPEAEGNA
jgi:hypothetical protein